MHDDTRTRLQRVVYRLGALQGVESDLVWAEAKRQYDSEKEYGEHNPLLTLDVFENALDLLKEGALQ